MSCDIHGVVERKGADGKYQSLNLELESFKRPWYSFFGWLGDVRNYSGVTPIAARRGWPEDVSNAALNLFAFWAGDAHSHSWVAVSELLNADYSAEIEDRRYAGKVREGWYSGALTAEPGKGERRTLRDFLDWNGYFEDLERLRAAGADRIVFLFDN